VLQEIHRSGPRSGVLVLDPVELRCLDEKKIKSRAIFVDLEHLELSQTWPNKEGRLALLLGAFLAGTACTIKSNVHT